MPSLFAGMDPYIEGPLWTTFQFSLIAEFVRQLAPRLRPRYLVLPIESFVEETPGNEAEGISMTLAEQPGEATAAPLQMAAFIPSPIPHATIEIRDVANRGLVTAIELLSPANKRGDGRKEYLAKRGGILLGTAHLVEIDLLRGGQRVLMKEPLPVATYLVSISKAEQRPLTEVWPIPLNGPLPNVPVPLLPDDDDVALDLQEAFETTYDLLGYDLVIDYSKPPEIPFREEIAIFVESMLDAASVRQQGATQSR